MTGVGDERLNSFVSLGFPISYRLNLITNDQIKLCIQFIREFSKIFICRKFVIVNYPEEFIRGASVARKF